MTSPDGPRATARGLAGWLQAAAPAKAKGEVTIALVSDERMRSLNRAFRGQDYATDVLSFSAIDRRPSTAAGRRSAVHARRTTIRQRSPIPPGESQSLGDIVIAAGVAREQAAKAGHSFGTELRVLAVHGLLHLLGYDHDTDRDQMARVENRLRRAAGLPEGLIERGRKRP